MTYKPGHKKKSGGPKSINDIDLMTATMAYVSKEDRFTAKDPNTYSGMYKGKRYTWQSGGFLK